MALILSGCGTTAQTMDIRVNVDESGAVYDGMPVRVIPKNMLGNKEYVTLSGVRGVSCKRYTWDLSPTPEVAIKFMKTSALSAGGNIITDVQCGNIPVSLVLNCWSAIECRGTVMRAKPKKTIIARKEKVEHSPSPTPNLVQQTKNKPSPPTPTIPFKPPNISFPFYSSSFPTTPVDVQFRSSKTHTDDIAVIIGNADYKKQGKDIPNVTPAYADAEGMKRYVMQALGIAEDNIIFIKDATQKDMVSTFGSGTNHKGKLFRYLVPGKSRVFVYYAGHGAPGEGDSNYLVPTDAKASLIDLNGYPIKTLYQNLSKLPAKSVTLVLEACFSGASQGGSLVTRSSGITVVPKASSVPSNITVISAGAADQIASWEEDKSHSLFTKYFLKGMSGEADANKDKNVSWAELKDYLAKTVTRFALRYYGRVRTAQIVSGG